MSPLNPKQEAFCLAYAALANGAAAARIAGYAPANAAHQASKLLRRSGVMARLAEFRAQGAARRAEDTSTLIAKLEPVYNANLEAGDHDGVLRVVELQARIAGLVQGGAMMRPRPAPGTDAEGGGHEAALFALGGLDGDGAEAADGR